MPAREFHFLDKVSAPAAMVGELSKVSILARRALEEFSIQTFAGWIAARHRPAACQSAPAAKKLRDGCEASGAVAQEKQILHPQSAGTNGISVQQIHLAVMQQKVPKV